MFRDVSENNWKSRFTDERERDKKEIQDWMDGSGSKLFAAATILIVGWLIVSFFWK